MMFVSNVMWFCVYRRLLNSWLKIVQHLQQKLILHSRNI